MITMFVLRRPIYIHLSALCKHDKAAVVTKTLVKSICLGV